MDRRGGADRLDGCRNRQLSKALTLPPARPLAALPEPGLPDPDERLLRRGDARIYMYEDREWLDAILHDVTRVMASEASQKP